MVGGCQFTVIKKNKDSLPPSQRISPDCFGTGSPSVALTGDQAL